MTIKIGDIVKVIDIESRYYEKDFSVMKIVLGETGIPHCYDCIRAGMKYQVRFDPSAITKIESLSRFPIGAGVFYKIGKYGARGIGVILTSNSAGSIVRTAGLTMRYSSMGWESAFEHKTLYITNRNVRILK